MNHKISIYLSIAIILLKYINNNDIKNVFQSLANKEEENMINIFIATHTDFENLRNNKSYKIISSKNGQMSSRYVGINHYRRYFVFLDNIPDMDILFKNYDLVLKDKYVFYYGKTLKENYCITHICKNFELMIDIIKELRPEYYQAALDASNMEYIYPANVFIMKKEDFINYGDFMFQILFEFDKRNNFTSDKDVEKFVNQNYNKSDVYSQTRLQGYLAERLSNIFYMKNFKFDKIKIIHMFQGFPRNDQWQAINITPEINITKMSDEIKEIREIKEIKKEIKPDKLVLKIIVNIIICFLLSFIIYRIYKCSNTKNYTRIGKKRKYRRENFNFEAKSLMRKK